MTQTAAYVAAVARTAAAAVPERFRTGGERFGGGRVRRYGDVDPAGEVLGGGSIVIHHQRLQLLLLHQRLQLLQAAVCLTHTCNPWGGNDED